MWKLPPPAPRRQPRFREGERVRVVGGLERGRSGEIVAVYPTHVRCYLVKLNEAWYVHYPEERLVREPRGSPGTRG
jgi:ribosomal protein L24